MSSSLFIRKGRCRLLVLATYCSWNLHDVVSCEAPEGGMMSPGLRASTADVEPVVRARRHARGSRGTPTACTYRCYVRAGPKASAALRFWCTCTIKVGGRYTVYAKPLVTYSTQHRGPWEGRTCQLAGRNKRMYLYFLSRGDIDDRRGKGI